MQEIGAGNPDLKTGKSDNTFLIIGDVPCTKLVYCEYFLHSPSWKEYVPADYEFCLWMKKGRGVGGGIRVDTMADGGLYPEGRYDPLSWSPPNIVLFDMWNGKIREPDADLLGKLKNRHLRLFELMLQELSQ